MDPLRKLALDAKLRLKQARTERFKAYDTKRKVLVEELEERERAFKKAKVDKQKEELAQFHETEKIKDEGRRLREEREKKAVEREEEERKASAVSDSSDEPTLGTFPLHMSISYTNGGEQSLLIRLCASSINFPSILPSQLRTPYLTFFDRLAPSMQTM